MSVVLLVVHI